MNPNPGEIILIPFPFNDFKSTKTRPALVLTKKNENNDIIIVAITSQPEQKQTIQISNQDLAVGKIPLISYIRYNKILTVNTQIVTKKVAKLNRTKLAELKNNLISFLEQEIN